MSPVFSSNEEGLNDLRETCDGVLLSGERVEAHYSSVRAGL